MQLAKRILACGKGERYVSTGYKVFCDTRGRPGIYYRDILGSYTYFKTSRAGRQLARVVMVMEDAESKDLPHTIKLLDLGKRYNVHLSEKLTTVSEEIGTWGWHVHVTSKSSKKNYMLPGTKYFSTVSVRDGW